MATENTTEALVPLTQEETALVSGGALSLGPIRGGCPFCTSGLQLAFQSLVTNPVLPQMQQQVALLG